MSFRYLLVSLSLLLQPVAVMFYKMGMNQVGQITGFKGLVSLETISRIITNPYLELGVFISGVSLFLGFGVMSNFKMSYIYPFTGLTYIIGAILAKMILKEAITPVHWIGISVIVFGIFLLNR